LHLAAHAGNTAIMQILLDSGASTEIRSRYFALTPLHTSIQAGHIDAAKLLLACGADITAESSVHETTIGMAHDAGNSKMITLLQHEYLKRSSTDWIRLAQSGI
jgi:Ankyrin repeat.